MGFILIVLAVSLNAGTAPGNPTLQPLVQHHFADELSCQQATSIATPAPGTRMVCVAAETDTVLQSAY